MEKSIRLTVTIGLTLLALFLGGSAVYAADEARDPAKSKAKNEKKAPVFTGEQLKLESFMKTLFEDSKSVNKPGKEGKTARKKIEGSVDWTQVAITCLGGPKAWRRQNKKNRAEFSSLLKDIISLTAYTRMDSFWNGVKYSIKKIEVKGKKATVSTNFENDEDEYELEYLLGKSGKKWRVQDLSFDDIKYSENIQEQISAFLKEKNFAVLLGKLRKRRAELRANEKGKKKASGKQASSE